MQCPPSPNLLDLEAPARLSWAVLPVLGEPRGLPFPFEAREGNLILNYLPRANNVIVKDLKGLNDIEPARQGQNLALTV